MKIDFYFKRNTIVLQNTISNDISMNEKCLIPLDILLTYDDKVSRILEFTFDYEMKSSQ